jgi:hypothetical protein
MYDPDNTQFSLEYFLRITEVWTGSSEAYTQTATLQAILAQEQLLHQGGSAMWEYILRESTTGTSGVTGELATKFENPIKWIGWNRTTAAIIDSLFAARVGDPGYQWTWRELDINKGLVVGTVTDNQPDVIPKVDIYQVPEPTMYPTTQFMRMSIRGDGGTKNISQNAFYKLEPECDNPIMLDWINSAGAVEQWMFSYNQQVIERVGEGVVIERPIVQDIEFITNTKRRFPGPTVQRITMTTHGLRQDQLDALKEIKETQSLRVYLTKDGTEWIDAIVVSDFTVEYQTKNVRFDFTVIIEMPDDFNLFDALKYEF